MQHNFFCFVFRTKWHIFCYFPIFLCLRRASICTSPNSSNSQLVLDRTAGLSVPPLPLVSFSNNSAGLSLLPSLLTVGCSTFIITRLPAGPCQVVLKLDWKQSGSVQLEYRRGRVENEPRIIKNVLQTRLVLHAKVEEATFAEGFIFP